MLDYTNAIKKYESLRNGIREECPEYTSFDEWLEERTRSDKILEKNSEVIRAYEALMLAGQKLIGERIRIAESHVSKAYGSTPLERSKIELAKIYLDEYARPSLSRANDLVKGNKLEMVANVAAMRHLVAWAGVWSEKAVEVLP